MSDRQRRDKGFLAGILLALTFGGAAPAMAADVSTIAIMAPEEATDFGWNQQGVTSAQAAGDAMGVDVMVAQGLGYGDVRPTLRELADDGADLIIAHASGYNTAAPEIAHETGVPVAIVDRPDALEPGLVADYTLDGQDGAYLAGRLAARMTHTGAVGIVTSGEPPSWNAQSAGFAQGVHDENPDVRILYAIIGSAAYADAAGGNRVARTVIAAGADIIFGQGDGSSFGMLQAVETVPAVDGGKVFFIDVIGDKSEVDTGHLLSSVIWDMTPVFETMISDLNDGSFGRHHYAITLADDSLRLLHTALIPDDVWTHLMDLRQQIIDGKIEVVATHDAERVRAMVTPLGN